MTQTGQNTEISQLDKALSALEGMTQNITEDDRKAAVKQGLTSTATLTRYLRKDWKAKNLDTAMKLIKFFNKRIEDREGILSATQKAIA